MTSVLSTPAPIRPGRFAHRAGSATLPFLTVRSAAVMQDSSEASVRRGLTAGTIPGYRLGRRWFIPRAEFIRVTMGEDVIEIDPVDAVRELTADLGPALAVEDLERFFGLRRPHLYDLLRFPGLVTPAAAAGSAVTTNAVLVAALVSARNGCPARG